MKLGLDSIPLEIILDENHTGRYFKIKGDKIVPRTRGIRGKEVQRCQPPKNLREAIQILKAFKSGNIDIAESSINLNNRQIHDKIVLTSE